MRKAIITKFIPQTTTKPNRIVASAFGGCRVIISQPDIQSIEFQHFEAAKTLCKKMHWKGILVGGCLDNGSYVFCFVKQGDDREQNIFFTHQFIVE